MLFDKLFHFFFSQGLSKVKLQQKNLGILHFGGILKCKHAVWRHFGSRSQVMAGKPGGILPVGYRRICNGFPGL